jgi:hypothetical protein
LSLSLTLLYKEKSQKSFVVTVLMTEEGFSSNPSFSLNVVTHLKEGGKNQQLSELPGDSLKEGLHAGWVKVSWTSR